MEIPLIATMIMPYLATHFTWLNAPSAAFTVQVCIIWA